MPAAPILLGVLFDFPQYDGGASVEEALRLGIAEVGDRLDREVELVTRHAAGLPSGTAKAVADAFGELDAAGVLAVIGPSISDNGLVVRELADAVGLPVINYTGGEITRSEWVFHYTVGSLEEEPAVLARHLAARGLRTVAVIHDHSEVGRRYADALAQNAALVGIDIVGTAPVSSVGGDLRPIVARLRAAQPAALCYLGVGVISHAVALALKDEGWDVPVVANSALMFGYQMREWRDDFAGWVYVDSVADDNLRRKALRALAPRIAAGPVGVAAYDIGRLIAEGFVRARHLTRPGVREGLERIKRLPAATGREGTIMGFGPWDHGALKGEFLVLREWRSGKTVEV